MPWNGRAWLTASGDYKVKRSGKIWKMTIILHDIASLELPRGLLRFHSIPWNCSSWKIFGHATQWLFIQKNLWHWIPDTGNPWIPKCIQQTEKSIDVSLRWEVPFATGDRAVAVIFIPKVSGRTIRLASLLYWLAFSWMCCPVAYPYHDLIVLDANESLFLLWCQSDLCLKFTQEWRFWRIIRNGVGIVVL